MAKAKQRVQPARMADMVPKNRNNLRRLIAHIMIPRGWLAVGQGLWVRKHGVFYQRFSLQPSRWSTADNYLNCYMCYPKIERVKLESKHGSHVTTRPYWIDARRAWRYDKAFETDGSRTAIVEWLSQVEAMLLRICLPWFDRVDSFRALKGEMRKNRLMGVDVDLRTAMKRRQA